MLLPNTFSSFLLWVEGPVWYSIVCPCFCWRFDSLVLTPNTNFPFSFFLILLPSCLFCGFYFCCVFPPFPFLPLCEFKAHWYPTLNKRSYYGTVRNLWLLIFTFNSAGDVKFCISDYITTDSISWLILMFKLYINKLMSYLIFQVELGKGLGENGLNIKSLKKDGFEGIFLGIGKYKVGILLLARHWAPPKKPSNYIILKIVPGFNSLNLSSWSNANFSFQFIASYV